MCLILPEIKARLFLILYSHPVLSHPWHWLWSGSNSHRCVCVRDEVLRLPSHIHPNKWLTMDTCTCEFACVVGEQLESPCTLLPDVRPSAGWEISGHEAQQEPEGSCGHSLFPCQCSLMHKNLAQDWTDARYAGLFAWSWCNACCWTRSCFRLQGFNYNGDVISNSTKEPVAEQHESLYIFG